MKAGLEQRVRERAYELWVAAGMCHGAADLHWLTAEQAIMNETSMPAAKAPKAVRATKPATKATKPAAKAVRRSAQAKPAPAHVN